MAKVVKTKSKNKNKNANKVKIFLANPSKRKCPSLDDEDVQHLERILKEAIDNSESTPRSFATINHICLGLASSLRSINNCTASCVLLSANIKPRYLLGLIARNAEVKDPTVTTYVQKHLEELTQRIFGVKALALVLPKSSSGDLSNVASYTTWIASHQRKSINIKSTSTVERESLKRKVKETSNSSREQLEVENIAVRPVPEKKVEVKQWGSSYISFSNDANERMEIDKPNSEKDEEELLDTLKKLASKVKLTEERPIATSSQSSNVQVDKTSTFETEIDSNDDDFLGDYAPLTVHKICPNPDRKPRKKRKKKSNKNLNNK